MGLRINTNVAALTAQRHLYGITDSLNRNFQRLATGTRIAVAADDAAGLAVSERLSARIRSVDQAARNAQDGISLAQTAEGSLAEMVDILIRMRELAIQAGNGTVNPTDRATLDDEFQALIEEVDRISGQTEFNTLKLLDGSLTTPLTLQVGPDTTANVDTVSITFPTADADALAISTAAIDTVAGANTAIGLLDSAINTVSNFRGDLGAVQNRLEAVISSLQVASENLSAARSRIADVDLAAETAELTKFTILQQAAVGVLAQANVQPQAALSLLQG